jgi:Predicted membrane protein
VLAAAGRRLGSDRRLADGLDRMIESGVRALVDHFHDELAGLVTGTIERWDAAETSTAGTALGRDLQYIRINGTVVGAGVGLILHAVVLALG